MRVIRAAGLFLCIGVLTAGSALGQNGYWPKPASTPGVDVPCSGCTGTKNGLLTPGYPSTITTFTGRFLDSQDTQDFQQPFRTARAFHVLPAISRGRIYMINGSALMAYDLSTFFTKVAAGQSMVSPYPRCCGSIPDRWLQPDEYFYAEDTNSGWHQQIPDGQERLFGIDYDDQGYVYLAYSFYGWGIVKDGGTIGTGNEMQNAIQWYAQDTSDDLFPPQKIAALKGSNGHYYALISAQSVKLNVFDVTDRSSPLRLPSLATRSLFNFAKTPAADKIGIATTDFKLQIFTTDSIVANGAPLLEFTGAGGLVKGVACDGTNFYATSDTTNGLVISVFAPSGSTYTKVGDYPGISPTFVNTQSLSWGDGYLVWAGTMNGSANIRVFRLQNGVPVEVDLGNYFEQYYTAGKGAGYTRPSFSYFWDSNVIKRNNKTYLITMGYSLGDVYELPSADSVAVTSLGAAGTLNATIPAGAGAGPFYGDPVAFKATTGAPSPMTVQWDFGNPEASPSADPNTAASSVSSAAPATVTHRYSGLTSASSLPITRTVKATNTSDSSITSSVSVTLQKPAVRFGVGNYKYLFVQPDASSPAPIVAGDSFFDASDGNVESHYDTWSIDGAAAIKTVPPGTGQVPVGTCGQHNVSFDAHYGPYTTGPTSLGSDMPIGIHGSGFDFTYAVRPFAAAIDITSDASNVTFKSLSRVSSDTNAISASQAASLTYRWELLDSANNVIQTTPTATVPVADFVIPKATFSGRRNVRAHLVLNSPTGVGASCSAFTSSQAYTGGLSTPDPAITGSCAGGNGAACSFGVSSGSGVNQAADGWTYSWSVSPATATPATGTLSTFSPVFTAVGTYTISLTVTNAIGTTPTSTTQNITLAGSTCATMTSGNTFIAFQGASSGCTQSSGTCFAGETVSLTVSYFGYDSTCATHTYNWSIGGTAQQVTHVFTTTTPVTVQISNGSQTFTASATITIGSSTPPPPPPPTPPPPSGGCATMTSTNTFISFQGNSSGCTQINGTCSAGETVTLTVSYFGYDVTCATHTYSWSFGGSTQSVNHTFNTTTQVAVTINNGSQSFQATATIPVGGSAPPPTPPPPSGGCATMTSANTFISFSGASSGCTQVAGTCSAGETVTLSVSYFGYNPSCATHSYSWSFGGSSQTVTHSFTTTTSVSVIVNNGSQSFTATANVPVGSSTPPPTPPPSGGCPTLIPGTSVYVSYLGSQSGCTRTAGDCTTAETIQFEADTFFYDFSCATHTFDWDYGDGTTHGTGKATTHQYVTAGAWPVRLKVTVNGQTYTMSQTVNVVPGAPYPFDFTTDALVGTNIPPYTYVFKAYSPTGLSANAYYWDFGDGNTCQKDSCGPTQTHTYADSKNYAVTLSVPGHSGSVQHNLKERHRPSEHP